MSTTITLQEHIRRTEHFLEKAEQEKALDYCREWAEACTSPDLTEDIRSDLLQLNGRLEQLNREQRLGIVTTENYSVESNRIRDALQDCFNDLKELTGKFPTSFPEVLPDEDGRADRAAYRKPEVSKGALPQGSQLDGLFKLMLLLLILACGVTFFWAVWQTNYVQLSASFAGLAFSLFSYLRNKTIELIAYQIEQDESLAELPDVQRRLKLFS